MRFGAVVVTYLMVGALMWGGGVIGLGDIGVGGIIIDQSGDNIEGDEGTAEELEGMGGPISEALSTVGGGALLAIWSVLSSIIEFIFWPIVTLQSVGAPGEIVVLMGGGLSMAFLTSIIRLVRGS